MQSRIIKVDAARDGLWTSRRQDTLPLLSLQCICEPIVFYTGDLSPVSVMTSPTEELTFEGFAHQ